MKNTIKKVILNLGNMRDMLNSGLLREQHEESILKQGVYFPSTSWNIWDAELLRADRHHILQSIQQDSASYANVHTLILACGRFSYKTDLLQEVYSLVQSVFTNAEIVCFFSLAPPWYVRRGILFLSEFYRPDIVRKISVHDAFTQEEKAHVLLEAINAFPSFIHIHEGSKQSEIETQKFFWNFVGANIPLEQLPINYWVPKEYFQIKVFLQQIHDQSPQSKAVEVISDTCNFSSYEHAFSLFTSQEDYALFMDKMHEDMLSLEKHVTLPEAWHILPKEDMFIDTEIKLNFLRIEEIFTLFSHTAIEFNNNNYLYVDKTGKDIFDFLVKKNRIKNTHVPFTGIVPKETVLCVLTPTYNHKKYIAQNIESVLAQKTNFPVIHIIADDASTDGTQDIILQYAQKYSHIIPLFQRQNSAVNNYKNLFEHATSPFVALCDGDDYFTHPHKLQKQVDFLRSRPHCALCFHLVDIAYEDNLQTMRTYPPIAELPRGVREEYYLADILRANIMQTSSVVYRWRFQDGIPSWFHFDMRPGDWYWHLLHAEMGKIGFLQETMSVYRRHDKAIYYSSEVSTLEHRRIHGMLELKTYHIVNEHFQNRYFRSLASLANSVFSSFLQISFQEKDDSLLQEASKIYPHFARHFLQSIEIVKHSKSV